MEETISVEQNGVKDGVKENQNVTKDVTKELTERQRIILKMINEDSFVTISEMSLKTEVATRTIIRDLDELQAFGVIARVGGRKEGHWVILTQSGSHID